MTAPMAKSCGPGTTSGTPTEASPSAPSANPSWTTTVRNGSSSEPTVHSSRRIGATAAAANEGAIASNVPVEMIASWTQRRGDSVTRAGARLEPLEALDRKDEDGRPADFDLERVRHEELARFHDRRHGVDDLRPSRARLPNDPHDVVDTVVVDAEDHRCVRLLEEAARRVQSRRPVLPDEQRVDERSGVLVVDDRDDQLHGTSIGTPTGCSAAVA